MAPIYQRLADGWVAKEIASDLGMQHHTLLEAINRHRQRLKARTVANALAMMIARGDVIARE
jgi:FixJ family two-component response regulator